ncbi:hypothetical protein OnM2_106031 [Erysiphe neolycopersici]|uniref:Uncharacterized protein n=1 Tax=Erysiphe neolycopersici TaxID=212602 RepID=A0A420H776_9PEZI|nr:hypothetical protein OnM2_106031 [Erysiphe neolycopersici]
MLDNAEDGENFRLKSKRLLQNLMDMDSIERAPREKDDDIPDIETIDKHNTSINLSCRVQQTPNG